MMQFCSKMVLWGFSTWWKGIRQFPKMQNNSFSCNWLRTYSQWLNATVFQIQILQNDTNSMQANSERWHTCQDDATVENPKDVFMPGNKGNSPLSKCRPMCSKDRKFLQWKQEAQMPCKTSAHASLAPHVQGWVRNSCCSTHVSAWPLGKDETHCRLQLSTFHIGAFTYMQNAWIDVGLVDQAKRSKCTQVFRRYRCRRWCRWCACCWLLML